MNGSNKNLLKEKNFHFRKLMILRGLRKTNNEL